MVGLLYTVYAMNTTIADNAASVLENASHTTCSNAF